MKNTTIFETLLWLFVSRGVCHQFLVGSARLHHIIGITAVLVRNKLSQKERSHVFFHLL
jgi:hypothetical protein